MKENKRFTRNVFKVLIWTINDVLMTPRNVDNQKALRNIFSSTKAKDKITTKRAKEKYSNKNPFITKKQEN